jgi:trk system potassium uptake protein TrkA
MSEKRSQYILVIGCGRLGAYLATQLSRDGHSVVVIDLDEEKFAALGVDFGGFRIEADAVELTTLKQAKAEKADRLIAVTGDDNINLAVAQMGRKLFNVPNVVARVSNPASEEVFRRLGINTICPLTLAGETLLGQVVGEQSKEQPQ